MENENLIMGSEIKQENMSKEVYQSKFREIVKYILGFTPVIQNINLYEDNGNYNGVITFDVTFDSVGLDASLYKKYQNEIFTKRFVDFIAEIIVRENINSFAEKIGELNVEQYKEALSYRKHETFGMKVKKETFIFSFHISLIQDILISDFRN